MERNQRLGTLEKSVTRPGSFSYPDPARSAWNLLSARDNVTSRRFVKQRQMRANILAAARLEMAELGFEGVQLRTIADHCEICVQTIYNLIGDRLSVLSQASEEWVLMLEAAGRERAAALGISELLAILGMFWASPLHELDYVTRAAHTSRTRDDPLNESFRSYSLWLAKRELAKLRQAGMLREGVDIPCLTRQLIATIHVGIYYWTVERYDPAQYWLEFEHGPALMLLAVVEGEERTKIERGLRGIRASLVQPPPAPIVSPGGIRLP